MSFKLAPLPLLVSLALTGCATQEALDAQTQPIATRLDRLEHSLKEVQTAGQDRHAVLMRDMNALRDSVARLEARLDQTQAGVDRLGPRVAQVEQRLDELATQLPSRLGALDTRVDGLVERLTEQATALGAAQAGVDGLTTRVGQVEQRLDEQATLLPGRLDALEQRVDGVAGQLTEQATRNTDLAAALTAAQAGLDGLTPRVGQAEQRLDELASTLPGRLDAIDQRVDGLSGSVKEALALSTHENIRLNGREAFTTTLTDDKTLYPINSPELGTRDQAKLDELVGRLAGLDQDYHLEIQGHTDDIGTEDYNYELAKARADVVKRYLHEQKGIALSRMSAISFGANQPLDRHANNNRRIHIRVLVLK